MMEIVKETAPVREAEAMGKREVRASVEGFHSTVTLERGPHRWMLDQPVSAGGSDLGPSPVNAFLGALGACMLITLQLVAERRAVPLCKIEGRVVANAERQVESVRLELDVWSAASQEKWEELLERAERGCYVSRILKPTIDYQISLRVHSAD